MILLDNNLSLFIQSIPKTWIETTGKYSSRFTYILQQQKNSTSKNFTSTANANSFHCVTSEKKDVSPRRVYSTQATKRIKDRRGINNRRVDTRLGLSDGQIFARVEIFGRMHSLSRRTELEKIPPERVERDRERSDSKKLGSSTQRGCRPGGPGKRISAPLPSGKNDTFSWKTGKSDGCIYVTRDFSPRRSGPPVSFFFLTRESILEASEGGRTSRYAFSRFFFHRHSLATVVLEVESAENSKIQPPLERNFGFFFFFFFLRILWEGKN